MTVLKKLQIFIINDVITEKPKTMTVKMNLYKWNDFRIMKTQEWPCNNLKPNAATLLREFDIYKYLNDSSYDVNEYMGELLLIDSENDEVISKNYAFPGKFKDLKAVSDCKPKLIIQTYRCERENHKISLEIKIQSPAIFMFISLKHDVIKKYRLSRNGFMQFEPIQIVQITFKNPNCSQNVTVENFSFQTLNKFIM